jgi:Tfp pilus assembly protein PilO
MNFNWKKEYYRYHRYFFGLQKAAQAPKIRSFAWLSLTIFTICFFLIVAIRPTLVTIAKLNREIKDEKEANRKMQIKINSIIAAQDEYAKNLDNLPLLDEALPDRSEFPRLAYFIEKLAIDNNLSLKSLGFDRIGRIEKKITKGEIPSNTTPLDFSVNVSGSYSDLKAFLTQLENSRRIVNINQASFSQIKKEDNWELVLYISGQALFLNSF